MQETFFIVNQSEASVYKHIKRRNTSCQITFFSRQDCFNIGYRTNPQRNIFTTKEPKGQMFKNGEFICERLGYDKETDRIVLQNETQSFKYEKLTSGLFGNGLDLMELCKDFPEWKS